MIPTSILRIWFFGLFSFVLIGVAIYCSHEWYRRSWGWDFEHQRSYFDPRWGSNYPRLFLAVAVGLLLWALFGGLIIRSLFTLLTKAKESGGINAPSGKPAEEGVVSHLSRADGSELHVECYGPEDAPAIILTPGWGADRTVWNYLRRDLVGRFRIIMWDLPGLGRSSQPADHDYRLENLADDLRAVLALAGNQPAILVGHSIGGMVILTFCRLSQNELVSRVRGIGLIQTTYTNPVRTTTFAGLFTALENPLIVPLLHLTIWLAPVVWLMNQLSYLNGSAHLSSKGSGFAGSESWNDIEHVTRLGIQAWPTVLARGMLGMLRYDETATLKTLNVPTLIVAGDRDPVCKREASERMQGEIPGAQPAQLAPAKHMGFIEHHTYFAEILSRFSSSCLRSVSPNFHSN
ncbi:MAG: alpha/beta hydrolase [Verrucomicrobia bacterium]|nr:alpha/beta hydrolase [Verrucomicrobiota bacterium]